MVGPLRDFALIVTCGWYHISIINDNSKVVRIKPHLGASLTIVILTTLEASYIFTESPIMLLENIYSTGITNDEIRPETGPVISTENFLVAAKTRQAS
jgi:hypothetical protein